SDEDLLFQIEDQNPQLNESLIGGWQLEHDPRIEEKGWSVALAAETIRRGRERANTVNVVGALDAQRFRWNVLALAAGCGAFLLLAWGVSSTDFFRTWFRRNLLLTSDQWPRQTHLVIEGVNGGQLIVPRGADHRQLVTVSDHSIVVPDEVTLEVDGPTGRVWQTMKQTGRSDGREHAFVFYSIASEFRFRAAGGDALTDWVHVRLVEPPTIIEMELVAILPVYTQSPEFVLEGVGPHSVLQGSRLRVRAKTNKPLRVCQLLLDLAELDLKATDNSRQEFMIELPSAPGLQDDGVAGGKYVFRLEDEAGLGNLREFGFTIRTRADQAPAVRAKLLGIAGMAVPRAQIPISLSVSDDFGIANLDFDCHWIPPEDDQTALHRVVPIVYFERQDMLTEINETAVLRVESLPLVPNSNLRFVVTASDHQPNPNVGSSREFLLRIVTEEELRADLLRREIEQRRALDQAYNAQMDLIAEVRQLAADPAEDLPASQREAAVQNKLLALFRAQRNVGTSLAAIASRFEEFLLEVRNNRLDEGLDEIAMGRSLTTRFSQEIATPLRVLDEEWVLLAAQNLEQCRRQAGNEVLLQQALLGTAAVQEEILNRIRQVMAAMEDSENYQDLINKLMEFKRIENEIKQQIKRLENPDRILEKDN
ncbi:MAG TPA: hypothetical protein PKD54_09715, partial [Pirellulaceae bacterium]|nr:hypothetical protein [Pirellulaceae bacterium]